MREILWWKNLFIQDSFNVLWYILLATGTVITEWDDGKARCNAFLKSEEAYKQFADQLVAICKTHGFDGWLVNIENEIEVKFYL